MEKNHRNSIVSAGWGKSASKESHVQQPGASGFCDRASGFCDQASEFCA